MRPLFYICIITTSLFLFGFSSTPKDSSFYLNDQPLSYKSVSSPVDVSLFLTTRVQNSDERRDLLLTIAQRYAENGLYSKALEIVEYFYQENQQTNYVRVLTLISLSQVKFQSLDDVLATVASYQSQNERNIVLEHLSIYLLDIGNINEAMRCISLIQSPLVRYRLLHQTMKQLAETDDFDSAETLLANIETPSEREAAQSSLLLHYGRTGQVEKATQLLNGIQNDILKQDSSRKLVEMYASTGRFDQGLAVLKNISAPNIYAQSLAEFTRYYAEYQRFEEAYGLANTIPDIYYRELALSYLCEYLAQFDYLDDSKNILLELTQADIISAALARIAIILSEQGRYDETIEFLSNIQSDTLRETTTLEIATNFGKSVEYHYPYLLIQQLEPPALRWKAASNFIVQHANNGWIDKTIQLTDGIEDRQIRDTTFHQLATLLATKEQYADAIIVTQKIEDPSLAATTVFQWATHITPPEDPLYQEIMALVDMMLIEDSNDLNEAQLLYLKSFLLAQRDLPYKEDLKLALNLLSSQEVDDDFLTPLVQKSDFLSTASFLQLIRLSPSKAELANYSLQRSSPQFISKKEEKIYLHFLKTL